MMNNEDKSLKKRIISWLESKTTITLIVVWVASAVAVGVIVYLSQSFTYATVRLNETNAVFHLNDTTGWSTRKVILIDNPNRVDLSLDPRKLEPLLSDNPGVMRLEFFPRHSPQTLTISLNASKLVDLPTKIFKDTVEVYSKDDNNFVGKVDIFLRISKNASAISTIPKSLDFVLDNASNVESKRLEVQIREQISNLTLALEGTEDFKKLVKVNQSGIHTNNGRLGPGETHFVYVTTNKSNIQSGSVEGKYEGNLRFSYLTAEGGRENIFYTKIDVTIRPEVNDPNNRPIAYNQNISAYQNRTIAITLQGNDVDNDRLKYYIISHPMRGKIHAINKHVDIKTGFDDGRIIYEPDLNYTGPDDFTFRTNDGTESSSTAQIAINIQPTLNFQKVNETAFQIQAEQLNGYDDENGSVVYKVSDGLQNDNPAIEINFGINGQSWLGIFPLAEILGPGKTLKSANDIIEVGNELVEFTLKIADLYETIKAYTSVPSAHNHPPVVDAGSDQVVNETDKVLLDGIAFDPDPKDELSYFWRQIDGRNVTLGNPSAEKTMFRAPLLTIILH